MNSNHQASVVMVDEAVATVPWLKKIVSGGQTGVDRGALDAALSSGFACGGWCPAGRLSESGPIPDRYPLKELAGSGYRERTERNVRDSDGTLIVHFGALNGGTQLTLSLARQLRKPVLSLDMSATCMMRAELHLASFIDCYDIGTLNVAGPRESKVPGAQLTTKRLISSLFALDTRKEP